MIGCKSQEKATEVEELMKNLNAPIELDPKKIKNDAANQNLYNIANSSRDKLLL